MRCQGKNAFEMPEEVVAFAIERHQQLKELRKVGFEPIAEGTPIFAFHLFGEFLFEPWQNALEGKFGFVGKFLLFDHEFKIAGCRLQVAKLQK